MEDIRISNAEKNNEEGAQLRKHLVEFTIDAPYSDFLKIMSDIEKNIQIATVSSLSLDPLKLADSDIELASSVYDVKLVLYSFD